MPGTHNTLSSLLLLLVLIVLINIHTYYVQMPVSKIYLCMGFIFFQKLLNSDLRIPIRQSTAAK
jgi:hypothetical protein